MSDDELWANVEDLCARIDEIGPMVAALVAHSGVLQVKLGLRSDGSASVGGATAAVPAGSGGPEETPDHAPPAADSPRYMKPHDQCPACGGRLWPKERGTQVECDDCGQRFPVAKVGSVPDASDAAAGEAATNALKDDKLVAWCRAHKDLAWLYSDGGVTCMNRLIVESGTEDCEAVPLRLGQSADKASDDTLREIVREADRVFARLLAPCPQCHTVGDDPACTTVIHHIPHEARNDINAARQHIREAIAALHSASGDPS